MAERLKDEAPKYIFLGATLPFVSVAEKIS